MCQVSMLPTHRDCIIIVVSSLSKVCDVISIFLLICGDKILIRTENVNKIKRAKIRKMIDNTANEFCQRHDFIMIVSVTCNRTQVESNST